MTLKSKIIIPLFVIIMILFVTSCDQNKSEGYSFISGDVEFGEDDYQKITSSNNNLGFKLLTKVDADEQENIFISPTSLLMALSMVYNGADGVTKEEIAETLQLNGIDERDLNKANASLGTMLYKDTNQVTVNIAHSIWLHEDYNFQEKFSKDNQDYYNATIQEIDIFNRNSAKRINNWVKQSTNNKIDAIVENPLDENLLALLINAIYFKGQWTYEFDQKKTKKDGFHLLDGTRKDVSFMELKEELYYLENEMFQAVKLPYGTGEMSMSIFLPQESSNLEQLKEKLTNENWEKWLKKFSKKEGTIILPKFTLAYETSLKNALMELGINKAFETGRADFSKMIEEDDQIYMSNVKQKTFIDVNEEGTEAAAATSIEMKLVSAPVDGPFYMDVNRPFFFTITDEETDAIIFMGLMSHPQGD